MLLYHSRREIQGGFLMTTTDKKILAVFLTNLGKYNEGYLIGEWVELPATDEELEKVFERIGINEHYEEFFITDYESDFGLTAGEYDDIEELNEMAEQLADLNEYELDIVAALLSDGYELAEALDSYENVIVYYDCNDMADVAEGGTTMLNIERLNFELNDKDYFGTAQQSLFETILQDNNLDA